MPKEKIVTLDKLPDILSPKHVADYVGIGRQRVYELCKYGDIKSFTIGSSRKIRKTVLIEWLDSLER